MFCHPNLRLVNPRLRFGLVSGHESCGSGRLEPAARAAVEPALGQDHVLPEQFREEHSLEQADAAVFLGQIGVGQT